MVDMCSQCRLDTGGNHEVDCPLNPDNQIEPVDQRVAQPLVGWTCPACGGGLSPFVSRCPCIPLPAPVIEVDLPRPSINVSVEGFISHGSEEHMAHEINRAIQVADLTDRGFTLVRDPAGKVTGGFRLAKKPESPLPKVSGTEDRVRAEPGS